MVYITLKIGLFYTTLSSRAGSISFFEEEDMYIRFHLVSLPLEMNLILDFFVILVQNNAKFNK